MSALQQARESRGAFAAALKEADFRFRQLDRASQQAGLLVLALLDHWPPGLGKPSHLNPPLVRARLEITNTGGISAHTARELAAALKAIDAGTPPPGCRAAAKRWRKQIVGELISHEWGRVGP